jgi:HEAT repeat protein
MRILGLAFLLATLAPCVPLDTTTPAQAEEVVRQALESKNPDTRKTGVVALSLASGNDPLFARLEPMMDDKDVQVRLAVVASLAEIKSQSALRTLHRALNDSAPEVSFAAAKALYGLNDPEGKQALLSVLGHESKTKSSFIRSEVRDGLRMMHTPTATFLYLARVGIGYVPVPGLGFGVASLQAILGEGGISGTATAALMLGKERDPETLAALTAALGDKDWHVRAAAVHSLALMNDVSLRKQIEPMIEDSKEEVRLRAAAGTLRLAAIEKAKASARKPGARPQPKK